MSLRQVPAVGLEVEILADGSFNAIVANASADVIEIADEDGFVAEGKALYIVVVYVLF